MITSERKLKSLIKKIILESSEERKSFRLSYPAVNLENTEDTNSSNQELQQKYLHDLRNENKYLEQNLRKIQQERMNLSHILDELKKISIQLHQQKNNY